MSNDAFVKNYHIDTLDYSTLNEPLSVYSKRTDFVDASLDLGIDSKFINNISFEELIQNKSLVILLIKKGISPSLFKALINSSPFDITQWTTFLDLPLRTIQRYFKEDKLLKPIFTEKIIEFAELIKQGAETFNSITKFKGWLCTHSYIFSSQRPCDLLSNSIGIRMVSDELINIDHGLFV